MDICKLVNLTSKAWALPILAALGAGTPGRQAALLSATGAARSSFGGSMKHLLDLGLVERNPGHGHPLRPEFRLTGEGAMMAQMARKIEQAAGAEGGPLLRRVWTVPILVSLREPRHFVDIRRSLPKITDRALSQTLGKLEPQGWIAREVEVACRPPRTRYLAVRQGALISEAVQMQPS